MSLDETDQPRDINAAASASLTLTAGKDHAEPRSDMMLQLAIVRAPKIIGLSRQRSRRSEGKLGDHTTSAAERH